MNNILEMLIGIFIGFIPDDTLCLLEEKFFNEMERRGFIIYTDDLDGGQHHEQS
ncbi:hypothetical protein [Anabaena sp. 4-3]|uniref:hypothetical protein n=1 Tax=Anabaena sp. 4-3 TaxID=1811979 RepID=UPI000A9D86CB|nr:hypothetical protein [Anabaena sp. 4-3]